MNTIKVKTPERYIPNDHALEYADDNIQIYYGLKNKRPTILAYTTRSRKPCVYEYCKTLESREAKRLQLIKWQEDKKQAAAARRIERTQKHNLQVGDILDANWGYEQTNIDYYQVVDRTDRMVTVRQIAGKITSYDTDMSGRCLPVKDAFLTPKYEGDDRGLPLKRVVSTYSWGPSVKIDEVRTANLWDGREQSWSSWY